MNGEISDRKPGHENFYCHLVEDYAVDSMSQAARESEQELASQLEPSDSV